MRNDCRVFWCLAVLGGGASVANAQDTRTFAEAECSYTLPGKEWVWLDPTILQGAGGKTLVLAHNPDGLRFVARYNDVQPGEQWDGRGFESYESGLLKASRLKKSGSKHLSFKGVPSYQINLVTDGGQETLLRILTANGRFYHLQVANPRGPIGPEPESESVFQGFSFTRPPEPPPPRVESADVRHGREAAPLLSACCGLVFVGGIVGLIAYTVSRQHRDTGRPDREDREF